MPSCIALTDEEIEDELTALRAEARRAFVPTVDPNSRSKAQIQSAAEIDELERELAERGHPTD